MDQSDFFSSLQFHFDQVLPWVAYRKPNQKIVKALLQETTTLHETENFKESGFVFAPFDTQQNKSILIPNANSKGISYEDKNTDQNEYVLKPSEVITPVSLSLNTVARDAHLALVKKAKMIVESGEMKKVVLSRKQPAPYIHSSPIKILKSLLKQYPNAFVYCWYHPKIGLWLGATPESLLSLDHRKLQTMSLAGTQKYTGTKDVSWGTKEKEEQQLVTDAIVKNLSPIVQNLTSTPVHTHKAGNVLHLRTLLEATVDVTITSVQQLINALHPTPAVCGLPKEVAQDFIRAQENYRRTYYTGFLGELNYTVEKPRTSSRRNVENLAYKAIRRHTDLYVNLRCMEIDAQGAQLYVGGGITADSDPEAEWQETINKLETMASVL